MNSKLKSKLKLKLKSYRAAALAAGVVMAAAAAVQGADVTTTTTAPGAAAQTAAPTAGAAVQTAAPAAAVAAQTAPATASQQQAVVYQLIVNGQPVTAAELPAPLFEQNGHIMVPLRLVSEKLGYTVAWNESGKYAQVGSSIMDILFYPNRDSYVRQGKLKIINLNMTYEVGAVPEIRNGRMYVPAESLKEFFNDVTVLGRTVTIEPSKAELQQTGEQPMSDAASKPQSGAVKQ